MNRSVPVGDYVEHFDPELAHHRAWLLAVLEHLIAHEHQALEEGGTLRRLWPAHQAGVAPSPPPALPLPAPPSRPPGRANPLPVPWFAQLDSATDEGRRMCFSSSCAMLLAFLKPGVLYGLNGDDQYLARVNQFGGTTDPAAQIQALASYGITARFSNQASFSTLEDQIVVGITPTHLIVHDPFGEADLVNGTTLGGIARFCRYSRRNFARRWMVEGGGTGWAVLAQGDGEPRSPHRSGPAIDRRHHRPQGLGDLQLLLCPVGS